MPLINVPTPSGLNEIALRLFFDAWNRVVTIFGDFSLTFETGKTPADGKHIFEEEWSEYVAEAQSELASTIAIVQNSSEIRLKSIICEVSPYLLLINGSIPLKFSNAAIDFTDQRTLDAVDLPAAVKSLTNFEIPESYLNDYHHIRKLRNRYTHLGSKQGNLNPRHVAGILFQQYIVLWPDGDWLMRRTKYDGNSAKRFFHDGSYSSVEDVVMMELPLTYELMDNVTFKKCFGFKKSEINGYCPVCIYNMARKVGGDPHPTVVRQSAKDASCLMCGETLNLTNDKCSACGGVIIYKSEDHICCLNCGE